jgi:hypothetical protein
MRNGIIYTSSESSSERLDGALEAVIEIGVRAVALLDVVGCNKVKTRYITTCEIADGRLCSRRAVYLSHAIS